MELRVLRYFLAVVREETISGAAETLHVTQPTLSRQLKELEEELGKKLFIRGKRKISLTEDGLLLRRRAQEIVELADQTEADFHSPKEFISGDVHIGGGETDGMRLIARAAKRMEREYPEVRYHLFSGNADDVTDRLDKGLLDFGVLIEPVDKKKYDYIKLPAFDTWGVLMRRDSPYAPRESLSPEDLLGLPLICSRQSLVQNELSGWLGKEFEQLNIVATYNLLYNASLMVDEGLGYALCLDRIINTEGSSLCFKPLVPRFEVGLVMVWKKYQVFSKAAKKFMETLQAEGL
ncbi:LysR family transcriptional regulator [Christensenella tenuis]|jgi:DNA-binding transcriptional LysR family regulator|uniref:LysR family transcriptional regulator n=1 Tax=Christensenella tenuis TaxID=2763033 RepID=A0ABR7EDC0_9FIRM|nr:LysR family transcriptional regulator [Christensenella tenuis]MBC5647778.1 LysR family transcriptional regulator [Christensenella tenuis]